MLEIATEQALAGCCHVEICLLLILLQSGLLRLALVLRCAIMHILALLKRKLWIVKVGVLQSLAAVFSAAGAFHCQRCNAHAQTLIVPARVRTSAAGLNYLRHVRSCAAAAVGNKRRHSCQHAVRGLSGLTLLQSMLSEILDVLLGNLCSWAIYLRAAWQPLLRIWVAIQRKLWIMTYALLQSMQYLFHLSLKLISMLSPLVLASCVYIVDGIMSSQGTLRGLELPSCVYVVDHWSLGIAALSLVLPCVDWHVPCFVKHHDWICRVLSAASMHCLYADQRSVMIAVLWPTFGKRPRDHCGDIAQQATRTHPATERTITATATTSGFAASASCATAGEHSFASTTLESLQDVISAFETWAADDGDLQEVRSAAQTLLTGRQQEVRGLCVPWGVKRKEKEASGKYGNRTDAAIKSELQDAVLRRARELRDSKTGHDATTESPGFDFTALFPTPNAATLAALNWAHGHTSDPDVAAWILFCNGLNQAVLAKSNIPQVKRQKLCQAAGISFTRQMKEATTDTLCQEQGKRICEIHQAKKFFCAVSRKRAAPESTDEMETTEPALPVRITNVSSAWLRIRTIPDADHWDLQRLKKVIDGLRYRCTRAGLDRLLEDDRKKTFKTLLQKLHVTQSVSFRLPPSLGHDTATTADEQGHQTAGAQPAAKPKARAKPLKRLELSWRIYHVKLRAIAQAFQWLPAPERKDAIDSPQQTPRTVFQLATDIKDAGTLLLTPFGHDFEEIYGPTTSRLLAYAELPRHGYGSFEEPLETMPFVYRDLQELILEQRRSVAEPNDTQAAGAAEPSSQRDQKSDDLACLLQDFTRDLCTTYFLVHFAFPPRRAEEAADVTLAAEPSGAATPPPLTPCDATEPANTANNTRLLNASLSPAAAKDMVAKFTEFLTENRLLPRVQHISAGHLMVLCIFHARLSWQKGPPIELTSRDKYWIPKPTYTPASRVQAPSPPFFVQQIQAFATEHGSPRIQPPRTCVLCGKGFVDRAALWRHCEAEHHSWVEARKRIFWEAEQLDALPLLPADKRRLTQNFAFAQTHSRPGESHFGQNKVCMKQRVGCAVCALVDFIDACFPCYLFKECPEPLQKHTSTGDEENASDSDGSDEDRMTAKERRRRGSRLRDEEGYYVIRAACFKSSWGGE